MKLYNEISIKKKNLSQDNAVPPGNFLFRKKINSFLN